MRRAAAHKPGPLTTRTAAASDRAATASALAAAEGYEAEIAVADAELADLAAEIAALRGGDAAGALSGGAAFRLPPAAAPEPEAQLARTPSAAESPRAAAACHAPSDAFDRSINERMEYELPEALQCSRKLTLRFDQPPESTLARKDLLAAFQWRRIHYDDEWIVMPSLEPAEVRRVDEAGAAAIHEPASPRVTTANSVDSPFRFLGMLAFEVAALRRTPSEEDFPVASTRSKRPLHEFRWRRLFVGSLWICVPSLHPEEASAINSQLQTRLARGAYAPGVLEMVSDMTRLAGLLDDRGEYSFGTQEPIRHVVMIIVVEAEVAPILEKLDFKDDEETTADLMGLARVRSGMYGSYKLSVLKVAESKIFHRHFSGYTQASAVAALAARLLRPSLLVSFGTAGGVPGRASVGDVILADGCLFLDRLRTRNKNAFDWGLWGGGCLPTPRMASALGLKTGVLASQIGYSVTALQEDIIEKTAVACLDMEAAPIAQILNQAQVNMIALKVISNGVYPGEPKRMEAEYHDNREEVSRRATEALSGLLDFLDGKTPATL